MNGNSVGRAPGRRGRALALTLGGAGLLVASWLALEVGVRLAPNAVPLVLLDRLPYHVRQRIDVGEGLFSPAKLVAVPRDDGGPALLAMVPGTVVTHRLDATDLRSGAVETVTLDDTGFCNPPARRWATADVDIVALGDSFTWCSAVTPDQAWPAQLEAHGGRPTYNLGRGGVGAFEYVQILKQYGLQRDPEIVILNIFEGNELLDARAYWRARAAAEPWAVRPLPWVRPEEPDETERPLTRRVLNAVLGGAPLVKSYALRLGLAIYHLVKPDLLGAAPAVAEDFRYRVLVNGDYVALNIGNESRDFVAAQLVAAGQLSPSVLDEALAAFADVAQQRAGFRAIVTYTPAAYTAYEGRTVFRAPDLADLTRRFSQTQRDWLREATRRYGLEFLDLTPALQAAAATSPEPLYFPKDLHLSAAGHRAVGAYLAEALREPAAPLAVATSGSGHRAAIDRS